MTATRIIVSGATTALARRTNYRKAFLAPWDPLVSKCWLYSLAFAQRVTGVAVHQSTLVINHEHTNVTPSSDNLPEFTRQLHRDMSCAMHALLCQERYDAPRQLWDDRQPHHLRLLDAPAQASHLVYEHLNHVTAGLVERPEDMPGAWFDFGLWKTGFIEVERPPVFFGEDRPERLRLELTPPPLLYRAFGGDLDKLVHHMHRLADDGLRALRAKRTRPVHGAKRVLRIHPWSEPRTMREPGGRPVPTFRIGARGIVGWDEDIAGARETSWFRGEHEGVRVARREGDFERRFPYGTYAMRVHHGAPVVPEPSPGAIVTAPGPLLCDVKAELARDGRGPRRSEPPIALLDEVRGAFADEAESILAHDELDLEHDALGATSSARSFETHARDDEAVDERPVVTRHRFDKRLHERTDARRVVVLRDRRRGRPPGSGAHGSDPPA